MHVASDSYPWNEVAVHDLCISPWYSLICGVKMLCVHNSLAVKIFVT